MSAIFWFTCPQCRYEQPDVGQKNCQACDHELPPPVPSTDHSITPDDLLYASLTDAQLRRLHATRRARLKLLNDMKAPENLIRTEEELLKQTVRLLARRGIDHEINE